MEEKNSNLDRLTDPKIWNINRFFVLSFKNCDNGHKIIYFDKYYMPLVAIKDFSTLIDDKLFFHQPIKKIELYEKLL